MVSINSELVSHIRLAADFTKLFKNKAYSGRPIKPAVLCYVAFGSSTWAQQCNIIPLNVYNSPNSELILFLMSLCFHQISHKLLHIRLIIATTLQNIEIPIGHPRLKAFAISVYPPRQIAFKSSKDRKDESFRHNILGRK